MIILKRLIRKSDSVINEEARNVDPEAILEDTMDKVDDSIFDRSKGNLVELNQLSEADIKHERCPHCKLSPLKREDGFKVCPSCEAIYKILDGKGYQVVK